MAGNEMRKRIGVKYILNWKLSDYRGWARRLVEMVKEYYIDFCKSVKE